MSDMKSGRAARLLVKYLIIGKLEKSNHSVQLKVEMALKTLNYLKKENILSGAVMV